MREFERRYVIYMEYAYNSNGSVLDAQMKAMFWFIAATEGKDVARKLFY